MLNAHAADTLLYATLGVATLLGVGANTVFGWWWADPLVGMFVVHFAIGEGCEVWESELFGED